MRFHSAPVIRLADAKPVQLGHVAQADGAWRLYVFADQCDPAEPGSKVRDLCAFLASDRSPLSRFTPRDADPDAVIDVRAIFQQRPPRSRSSPAMPSVLLPRKGRFSLVDCEKVFCPDLDAGDIFDLESRGLAGPAAWSSVRPDQYISRRSPA